VTVIDPADCSHSHMVATDADNYRCGTCGLTIPRRTVAEHLTAMRADIAEAKGRKR
jgi:hypothetical protein